MAQRARGGLAAVGLLLLAPALLAQSPTIEVGLTDGAVWLATEIAGDCKGTIDVLVGSEHRRIAANRIVALSGTAVQVVDLPAAQLAGGDIFRGTLVGGDAAGDRVDLLSPVLGPVDLRVERLAAFVTSTSVRLSSLRLPEGVGEALFQRAAFGHDVVAGSLHQFGEKGVRFQPTDGQPRWFGLADFLALRIADASPPTGRATATLLTRTGDRLSVVVRQFTGTAVQCEREGGATFEVRFADLASLAFLDAATFVSELQPSGVAEAGYDGDVVHPWQRDASALGGPLVAGGRSYGKGLGVHARSRLSFSVPAAATHFWTRVALDDTSAETRVVATADVRVLVDDAVVFEKKGLVLGAIADTGLVVVRPGSTLTLEADFGAGRDIGDRVDWLLPVFLPGQGRRP